MVHARCKFSLLLNAERAMPQSIKNAEAKFRRPVLATLVVSLVTSWVSSRKIADAFFAAGRHSSVLPYAKSLMPGHWTAWTFYIAFSPYRVRAGNTARLRQSGRTQ